MADSFDADAWLCNPDLLARLRLLCEPGVGPVTALALTNALGGPARVLAASYTELAELLNPNLARRLSSPAAAPVQRRMQHALEGAADGRWQLLTPTHPHWPAGLMQLHDPPILLFARGQTQSLLQPAVAVVGTRRASMLGIRLAEQFATDLIDAQWIVGSGLALGIDAAAHGGALQAAGLRPATWAVLGSSIDQIHPTRHEALAARVAQQGALISELLPGVAPSRGTFPRRNRLVAALCTAVVVIEAGLRSGALITARLALELGREVAVVPGPVPGGSWSGGHRLLRDGAALVESAHEVLELLGSSPIPGVTQELPSSRPQPSAAQRALLAVLGAEGTWPSAAAQVLQWPLQQVQTELTVLELQGWVSILPDGRHQVAFV